MRNIPVFTKGNASQRVFLLTVRFGPRPGLGVPPLRIAFPPDFWPEKALTTGVWSWVERPYRLPPRGGMTVQFGGSGRVP